MARRVTDRAPTIVDVAALSGVSKSTVSNVLHGRSNVAPKTRERVLVAVGELGYRPNAVARSLVRNQTDSFGVLIGDPTNTYFGELLGQVERFAAGSGFSIIISNARLGPEEEVARLESLFEQRVSGILLCQYSGAAEVEELLSTSPVPVVAVSCRSTVCDSSCTDDRAAERVATEHLMSLGHRRIGLVVDRATDPQTNQERSLGYEDALRMGGLVPDPAFCFTWDFRGREAAEAAVAEAVAGERGPTAIVATSDDAAIAMIDALESRGRPVPEQVSVVGYDGVPIGAHERIALTTMVQPSELIAARAVEMLERRIAGQAGPPIQSLFESELVVRHSTAPPPAAAA